MKIKPVYIILFFILLVGIRGYNYFFSEYYRYDEGISQEINQRVDKGTGIVCVLIPRKIYYRIGERPELDVVIINKTDSVIYLPGNMDGSYLGLRLPVINFKVLNRSIKRTRMFCPMFNRMVPNELTRLAPGECFNPLDRYRIETQFHEADTLFRTKAHTFMSLENYWPHEDLEGNNFLLPGNYDLQFVYSTVRDTTDQFMFDLLIEEGEWPEEKMGILDSIPEVELKSNVVRLKYRMF